MPGSSLAVFQRLAGATLAILFQFLVARSLGAGGAGLFFLSFTTAWVIAILCRGGLDLALVRFIAARLAVEDPAGVRHVYRRVLRRAIVASLLGTAFLALAAEPLADHVFQNGAAERSILVMACCVAPIVMYRIHGEALRGLGKVQTSQFVINLAVPITGLALLPLLVPSLGIDGALWSHIAAHALAAAIGITVFVVSMRSLPSGGSSRFDASEFDRALAPLYQLSVLNLLQSSVPTLVLGAFRSEAEVGVYGVAQQAAQFLLLILLGHNAILGPKFAGLHARADREGIARLAGDATRRMTLEALPFFVLFVAAPGAVLGLFGPEFAIGATALAILATGQLVNVGTGSIGLLLVMSGNERAFRNAVTVAVAANIALNVALAPRFGITGAATATAAGVVIQNAIAAVMVRRRLGFWVAPFATTRPIDPRR